MKSSTPPGRGGPDFRGRVLGGRFHLDALVGRGGTASVYAARDRHMRRRVAIKVLHPEHTRSEEQRRRIRQEARVGGWIEHRNGPLAHLGADEAEASLAAWTCFDYGIARDQAARAAELNRAWSPLALLMSLVPDDA